MYHFDKRFFLRTSKQLIYGGSKPPPYSEMVISAVNATSSSEEVFLFFLPQKFPYADKQQKQGKSSPKKGFIYTFCNEIPKKYSRYSKKQRIKCGFPFYKAVFPMGKKGACGAGQKEKKVYPLGRKLLSPRKSGEPKEKNASAPNSKSAGKPRKKPDKNFRYTHSETRFQSILPAEKVTSAPKIFRSKAGLIFLKKTDAAAEPMIPPGMNFAASEKSNSPSKK